MRNDRVLKFPCDLSSGMSELSIEMTHRECWIQLRRRRSIRYNLCPLEVSFACTTQEKVFHCRIGQMIVRRLRRHLSFTEFSRFA